MHLTPPPPNPGMVPASRRRDAAPVRLVTDSPAIELEARLDNLHWEIVEAAVAEAGALARERRVCSVSTKTHGSGRRTAGETAREPRPGRRGSLRICV
jgi:hypothetical protein